MNKEKSGIEQIVTERKRQIEEEGYGANHDDEHTDGSLALAAICYAAPKKIYYIEELAVGLQIYDPWPWDLGDKRFECGDCKVTLSNMVPEPSTYTRDERIDLLVKAGALIAAEIDRLQRRSK